MVHNEKTASSSEFAVFSVFSFQFSVFSFQFSVLSLVKHKLFQRLGTRLGLLYEAHMSRLL